MLTPRTLVQQMMEFATDELPARWQGEWQRMQGDLTHDQSYTLQGWLGEVYFDDDKQAGFTREEIAGAAGLIARLLRFEPSRRATASEALADAWFKQG